LKHVELEKFIIFLNEVIPSCEIIKQTISAEWNNSTAAQFSIWKLWAILQFSVARTGTVVRSEREIWIETKH